MLDIKFSNNRNGPLAISSRSFEQTRHSSSFCSSVMIAESCSRSLRSQSALGDQNNLVAPNSASAYVCPCTLSQAETNRAKFNVLISAGGEMPAS